ncbi:PspC domain-containing protein [Pseudoalteromonas sp. SMS1]|uniref:PspC domain-containing protein n=1 Tax=Pseudoalteromonas sp. SMS1 TaxID=2908894 RepID=UPI001F29CFD7|nr:PspC domain-containing protein [Pseudoalteromonas sp. SMS1]MCF2857553.1 PspC domain-containing protein [Pseudoalteromonas sp. SMS1]
MDSQYYKSQYQHAPKKKLAGVCIQVAKRFDLPVWLVRVLLVLLALKFTWPCIVGYIIGWLCFSPSK